MDEITLVSSPPRKKGRSWLLPTIVIAILATVFGGIAYALYCGYRVVSVVVPECYAQECAGAMVIEYLKEHEGQWPRSWDDLDESYQSISRRWSPIPLETVRRWVDIRFDADAKLLKATPLNGNDPPFLVVYLKGGGRHHWSGREPNRMIWNYLNGLDNP